MRDSDWSRQNVLRSDWLGPSVALITTYAYVTTESTFRVQPLLFSLLSFSSRRSFYFFMLESC